MVIRAYGVQSMARRKPALNWFVVKQIPYFSTFLHFDAHSGAENDSLKIPKIRVLEHVSKNDSGMVRDSVKSQNFEIQSHKKHVCYFFVQCAFVKIGP